MPLNEYSNSSDYSKAQVEITRKPSHFKPKAAEPEDPIRESAPDVALLEDSVMINEGPLDSQQDSTSAYPANPELNEHQIRECAYYLWKNAGEPEGGDWEFWEQARAKLASQEDPNATIRSIPIDIDPTESGLPDIFKE